MDYYFFDTSILCKRYINEKGSEWVRSITQSKAGHVIAVSEIAIVEASSAFARMMRRGVISAKQNLDRQILFLAHMDHEYLVIRTSQTVFFAARAMINAHSLHHLRPLDVIQLASAIVLATELSIAFRELVFVTADTRLAHAARDEGFMIYDPTQE